MLGDVVIDDASTADLDAIGALRTASWQAAYPGIVAQDFLDSMPSALPANVAARIPAAPDEVALVARDSDRAITGFSLARASSEEGVGEVYLLYVDAQRWGLGTGTALLVGTEDRLARLGFAEAILWTFAENTRAHAFYARAGWCLDGAVGGWDVGGQYVPEVRFRRRLHSAR